MYQLHVHGAQYITCINGVKMLHTHTSKVLHVYMPYLHLYRRYLKDIVRNNNYMLVIHSHLCPQISTIANFVHIVCIHISRYLFIHLVVYFCFFFFLPSVCHLVNFIFLSVFCYFGYSLIYLFRPLFIQLCKYLVGQVQYVSVFTFYLLKGGRNH